MTWKQLENTNKEWSDGSPTQVTWQISQGTSLTYQQLDSQVIDLVTNGKWDDTVLTWNGVGATSGMSLQWTDIGKVGIWTDITDPNTNPNWS